MEGAGGRGRQVAAATGEVWRTEERGAEGGGVLRVCGAGIVGGGGGMKGGWMGARWGG